MYLDLSANSLRNRLCKYIPVERYSETTKKKSFSTDYFSRRSGTSATYTRYLLQKHRDCKTRDENYSLEIEVGYTLSLFFFG